MKFEMPKMNVAIFSRENIVTTSTGGTDPAPAVKSNVELAVEAAGTANTTVVTAADWVNA